MIFSAIFEDFLEYCIEDNPKLTADIKTWIADFFDLEHRNKPVSDDEEKWINENLSVELQRELFGISLSDWKKKHPELVGKEYEYEVVIPYFMRFRISSDKKLTKIELLTRCHYEDGKLTGCDDDKAELNSGEIEGEW